MMNLEQIWQEYETNKRLSGKAMLALKAMLHGDDPYAAITLVGDTAAFQLAPEIASHLKSTDVMVRWNAAAVLFGRFRDVRYGSQCLELLKNETDTMVRGVGLSGAGEILPLLEDPPLQQELALILLHTFESESEYPEMRTASYE